MNFPAPNLSGALHGPPLPPGSLILGSAVIHQPSRATGSVINRSEGDNQQSASNSTPVKTEKPASSAKDPTEQPIVAIQPRDEDEIDNNPGDAPDDDVVEEVPVGERGSVDPPKRVNSAKDSSGFPMKEMLKLCWQAYKKDNLAAQLVRGLILGFPEGQNPTQEQIDESELFTMHAPSEGPEAKDKEDSKAKTPVLDVHSYWLPFLQEQNALGDCPPVEFKPLLTFPRSILLMVSVSTSLMLINHQIEQISKHHFLSTLHTLAALKRGSIGSGND